MPIILNNINKSYNDVEIFKNFNFTFEEGNIYALTGTIGIGKTTLLNIICGLVKVDSGTITGIDKKIISYLFQDNRLFKNKTVSENIRFVLKDCMNRENSDKIIEKYLKLFDLYDYKECSINKLSGGMQKKLAIARALAIPNFNVLLLDEPFNNIDLEQKQNIMENITKMNSKETIVIMVTHNVEDVKNFVDKVYVLNEHPNSKFEIRTL